MLDASDLSCRLWPVWHRSARPFTQSTQTCRRHERHCYCMIEKVQLPVLCSVGSNENITIFYCICIYKMTSMCYSAIRTASRLGRFSHLTSLGELPSGQSSFELLQGTGPVANIIGSSTCPIPAVGKFRPQTVTDCITPMHTVLEDI